MGRGKGIHERWALPGWWGKAWRGRGVRRHERGGAERRSVAATNTACLPVPNAPPWTALSRGGGFFGERLRGGVGPGPFGVSCGAVLHWSSSSAQWCSAWWAHPLSGWPGRRESSQLMSAIWRRAAEAARALRVPACSSPTTGAWSTGRRESPGPVAGLGGIHRPGRCCSADTRVKAASMRYWRSFLSPSRGCSRSDARSPACPARRRTVLPSGCPAQRSRPM